MKVGTPLVYAATLLLMPGPLVGQIGDPPPAVVRHGAELFERPQLQGGSPGFERHKPTTVDRWLAAAGAIGGSWGLGVPAYAVLDRYASDNRIEGDYFFSPTANAALVVSSSVGAALGFSGVLRARDAEFRFKRVLLGTTVASLPFLLGIDGPFLPYYALTLGTTLQAVGALVSIMDTD